ncbi:MAG: hypothetical protein ACKVHE_25695 [Planctomycetales bacterium]
MIQPEQSLNVLREAVDGHLPWQAGRHLCELFDYGLLDGTEIAGKRKVRDLRVLSPVWREKQIERLTKRAMEAGQLGGTNQEPADPECLKFLQKYHKLCESVPAGKPADLDSLIVRATWWRFILRELTRSEDYKTRLGTKVEQNFGTIVGMLEYWAHDYSSVPLDASRPFSGDSTEERLRLRLHTAARIQTVACEIVAELLESEASARSSRITIESEELQRQAKNNSDADSDAAQPTGAATQTSDQPDETGAPELDIENQKKGMTWQEACKAAEKHLERNPWPGLNAFALILKCAPSTLSKATKRSVKLAKAKSEHESQSKSVTARSNTAHYEGQLDPGLSSVDDHDDLIHRLINDCREPSERARILEMSTNEQLEMAAIAYGDPDDPVD